ncbi:MULTISPECIES: TylF/MycF/NovP-related O-methyltransferase [Pseudanabaena]|uniref:Macrocin-O-methyltransferase n=2 Tax=Pseudanabaena TaxID=1152 RepID=L8N6K1_9CYAN|nr:MULTISPECIES: TylF/MycF/NovP-related O-methyltransferase [Pseudanabaena]ELS34330.1 macrocin-O-methyltransferase [Pseudanabaena biceps PCC 7429]MDG3493472.1 TylF/MycF/NovP-related O-methyltransferase [Pseudanabaena catenata USMAC16]
MTANLTDLIKQITRNFGFDIVRYHKSLSHSSLPPDFDQDTIDTIFRVNGFTQTSPERLFTLCEAVRYIVTHKISGDIVECGVWKGGSIMAIAYTLMQLSESDRSLYLFDTFEGMTEPTDKDISNAGEYASDLLKRSKKEDQKSIWCYSNIEEVRASVLTTGYSRDKIHFVKGKVEDTIPEQAPQLISLLRLDTDWYESTRHELIHLFPRIAPFGVIIIDDYGHWQGVRKAVDEYIQENNIKILLNRVDYTGRIGVVSPR